MKIRGYSGSKFVDFWPTCSQYFVIVEELLAGGKKSNGLFSITHVESGYCVARSIATIQDARMIAGAISGLPFDWADIKGAVSSEEWKKLPGELQVWIFRLLRDDVCAVLAEATKAICDAGIA